MSLPRVAVVGAGTMGHGMAYVAALAGCAVALTDSRADALPQARAKIDGLIAGAVQRVKLKPDQGAAVAERLRIDRSLDDAVQGAAVVIEAVGEDPRVKQRLLADIERVGPPYAPPPSNTPSLSLRDLPARLNHPGGLLGVHFFN